MKIVHITPHLGGGVGKAHAALCAADADASGRHYVLLEAPRDLRHVDAVRATGATVTIAPDTPRLDQLMAGADIVQFEWWNHPLICGLLAGHPLPAMRSVIWSHVSGVSAPFIPSGLIEAADRFVFTSACSRCAPNLSGLDAASPERTAVINSGFGYAEGALIDSSSRKTDAISYLGTVDFIKMSPALLEVVDRLLVDDPVIDVWGGIDPGNPVHAAIAAMKHPHRIRLRGHTEDPGAALAQTSIFLYLLQPVHFGTAENALVEAMSLGCAPLVFDNPCERAIVRDGETGLVARSIDDAVELLGWMLAHPREARRIGRNAQTEVLELKTPSRSITALRQLWQAAMQRPKRVPDFKSALGSTPRDWYQTLQGDAALNGNDPVGPRSASKGSLAHFKAHFSDLDKAPGTPVLS